MIERYPSDEVLLAMHEDARTGVQYIPTGKSPYYLEFRKLVHRLIESSRLANDLRVYAGAGLLIGVRPGGCAIGGADIDFDGAHDLSIADNATSSVWIDSDGEIQISPAGFPADRTTHMRLAQVTAAGGLITDLLDRRAQAMLLSPDAESIGLSAGAPAINRALDGADESVTAAALNALTGGPQSAADALHRHLQALTDQDARTGFDLVNENDGDDANIALRWSLPAILASDVELFPSRATGQLRQRYSGFEYALVGCLPAQWRQEGAITATLTGKLIGVIPADGIVRAITLSLGTNIQSSTGADAISAIVKVNGATLTSTHSSISSAAGAGFRSTAQSHGVAGIVKSDGTQIVKRGDLLTVDLVRTASGTVSAEAADACVLIILLPHHAE